MNPEAALKEHASSQAKFFGVLLLLSVAMLLAPHALAKAFGLLGALGFGLLFTFHAATMISSSRYGCKHSVFQIAVAILVPLALSAYFLTDVQPASWQGVIPGLSRWSLLPIAVLAYVGWAGSQMNNENHPFRGYFIAATVLFAISLSGHLGITSYTDEYEESVFFVDEQKAAEAAESARYFMQYLVYCGVTYTAMFARTFRT